jgi:hypothetical protein
MTLTQLEERVAALEEAVEELQKQQRRTDEFTSLGEEEIIPGTEYPIVLNVPPTKVIRVQARIRSIRRGSKELALTDEEWALFAEGEDHGS